MATLSLSAVSVGVATALNVSALTSLVGGRIADSVPLQGWAFPYVWYVVSEDHVGAFGTTDGPMRVSLRVHVATDTRGAKQAQDILAAVKTLLKDVALTLSGAQMCGRVFYLDTSEPFTSVIAAKECLEMASNYYLFVEPSA